MPAYANGKARTLPAGFLMGVDQAFQTSLLDPSQSCSQQSLDEEFLLGHQL
jgi:hypothetical protein